MDFKMFVKEKIEFPMRKGIAHAEETSFRSS